MTRLTVAPGSLGLGCWVLGFMDEGSGKVSKPSELLCPKTLDTSPRADETEAGPTASKK